MGVMGVAVPLACQRPTGAKAWDSKNGGRTSVGADALRALTLRKWAV